MSPLSFAIIGLRLTGFAMVVSGVIFFGTFAIESYMASLVDIPSAMDYQLHDSYFVIKSSSPWLALGVMSITSGIVLISQSLRIARLIVRGLN